MEACASGHFENGRSEPVGMERQEPHAAGGSLKQPPALRHRTRLHQSQDCDLCQQTGLE